MSYKFAVLYFDGSNWLVTIESYKNCQMIFLPSDRIAYFANDELQNNQILSDEELTNLLHSEKVQLTGDYRDVEPKMSESWNPRFANLLPKSP